MADRDPQIRASGQREEPSAINIRGARRVPQVSTSAAIAPVDVSAERASVDAFRLVKLDGKGGDGIAAATDRGSLARRHWRFLFCVVVPTCLAVAYYGLLAANRYETEVKFVVRTPLSSAAGQLSSMMQGSNVVRSADDAHIVNAYLKSRTALQELMNEIPVQDILRGAGFDIFWSYPRPLQPHTDQRLYEHFQRFVNVQFDQTTGISTLRVQSFIPKDAAAIAAVLIQNAEKLINRLNTRVLEDAVEIAQNEVKNSQSVAVAKQLDLTQFRMRWSLVDPVRLSNSAHDTIAKLSFEVAIAKSQLSELHKMSPNSAQMPSLQARISALSEQIRNEQQQLVGKDGSLALRLAEYERLLLFREFAERSFVSSMTLSARNFIWSKLAPRYPQIIINTPTDLSICSSSSGSALRAI
jgi:capsular polysaccharide transport system permease protein